MLKKQDRQGVRTPAGLEQKYNFSQTEKAATEARQAAAEAKGAAAEARQAADNAAKVAEEAKSAVDAFIRPVDYIIECGKLDGWHYEKWNSGKAVCWQTTDVMLAHYNQALNDSTYFTKLFFNFPTDLFTSAPSFVSVNSVSSDDSYLLEERIREISDALVGIVAYVNSTEAVNLNVQFVVEAKGSCL